jgi:hypothetical protein
MLSFVPDEFPEKATASRDRSITSLVVEQACASFAEEPAQLQPAHDSTLSGFSAVPLEDARSFKSSRCTLYYD